MCDNVGVFQAKLQANLTRYVGKEPPYRSWRMLPGYYPGQNSDFMQKRQTIYT